MYMKQKKKSLFSLLLALMMMAGLMQGMTVETKAATNSVHVHPSLLKLHLNYFFLFSLFTLSMLCYNDTVILHRTSVYDAIILQILPVIVKKYMI